MPTKKETEKIAVISGGAGYLGSAIARKLSDRGFVVVIISIDITNTAEVEKIAKEIKNQFGKISTIIHAASAPLVRKPILAESREEFESQLSVNVIGAFNLFKFFCPMVVSGGAVIGITSQAINGGATHSPRGSYIPAKCALRGLLRVLSQELREQSIRVYGVAPAFMPGGLNRDIPKAAIEFIKKKSSPEEITSPKEVVDTILDIINDKSGSMNGKSIAVPGRSITNL